MSNIQLTRKLPAILKRVDFWVDLIDVVEDELQNLKVEIDKKKFFLKVRDYSDSQILIDLANSFGYDPNLILRSDLDFVKQETESVYWKIINKGTYRFYKHLFKLIPYQGRTYIVYYDDVKLVKAVKYEDILTSLQSYNFIDIFTDFFEQIDFEKLLGELITLDENPPRELDEDTPWELDSFTTLKPTSHIISEYVIQDLLTLDSEEFLMIPDYFKFLEKGMQYGRKVTNVPHAGCQLNLVTNETGFYDTYDYGNTGYSFPVIKTKFSTTSFYKALTLLDPYFFDSTPDVPFDQALTWHFDNDIATGSAKIITELFDKAVIGNGSKSMFSKNYPNIWRDLLFFASFDEYRGTDIDDLSANDYTTTIEGSYERVQGISGKTVEYDGTSTQVKITNFLFGISDHSLCFWIRANKDDQTSNDAKLFYHSSNYDIWYDKSGDSGNGTLNCTITGASSSVTLTANYTLADTTDAFVVVELDTTNDEAKLYINDMLQDTEDISTIGNVAGTVNTYIGSSNGADYFKGLIDEFRIYQRLLTSDEKTYLYSTKLGSLKNLSNRIYTLETISINEMYENNNWKILQVSFPANTINEELVGVGNDSTDIFAHTLEYTPIIKKYTVLTYSSGTVDFEIKDDGFGNLIGTKATGTIDYDTGAIALSTYKDTDVFDEIIDNGPVSNFVYSVSSGTPVLANSATLKYTISSVDYEVPDDGAGNFSHATISSGTIDYVSGELDVTFTGSATDVKVDYTYRSYSTPSGDILAEYKVDTNIDITEVGVFDNEDKCVLYGTFPPIRFNSIDNHVSFHFMVKDTG